MKISKTPLLAALLTALWAGACTPAHAQSPAATGTWFTVMGDPADANVNTIEVDPVDTDGDAKTMQVRVSRSTLRTSWDGVRYRSYTATVLFECDKNKARYLSLTYYSQPSWQGTPDKTVDYTTGTPRMMEFRDVTPNPTQRILHAACSMVAKK